MLLTVLEPQGEGFPAQWELNVSVLTEGEFDVTEAAQSCSGRSSPRLAAKTQPCAVHGAWQHRLLRFRQDKC